MGNSKCGQKRILYGTHVNCGENIIRKIHINWQSILESGWWMGFTQMSRKAFTVKMEAYPTMIMLNAAYDKKSRMVLCAHELGHALLHEEGMNHFSVNEKNVFTNTEYEANLFAVSLLFDDDQFNMPISEMSNYILKSILDWNIREK